jgi:LPXTG-site transpeptidase (sortase) family protein
MGRALHWTTEHIARSLLVLTALLLLVGAVCLVAGLQEHRHPLAGPAPQRPVSSTRAATSHAGVVTTPTVPPPAVVARSVPTAVRIPALGLSVPLTQLGLNADGTVEVPTSVQVPGWFSPGPSPGQVGSAVILGHVDSYQGTGVFFQLRTLQPGDQVNVNLADGVVATFKVTSVVMYQKTQFPDQQVYGSNGSSELQLVTCGGTFDSQTGHYLSNIVVYSSFVSAT